MKKYIILLISMVFVLSAFAYTTSYADMDENILMTVNGEVISNELLNARTQMILIFSDLKSNYEDFYTTLTRSASGSEFIKFYSQTKTKKLINDILFIQFAEKNMRVDLKRESVKDYLNKSLNLILSDSKVSKDDLDIFLLSKGYTSKQSYIDDKLYEKLSKDSIDGVYKTVTDSIVPSDDEIKAEFAKTKYYSDPQVTVKVLTFKTTEEASKIYNRFAEGTSDFDSIYKIMKDKSSADEMSFTLDNQNNQLYQMLKSKPPMTILNPIELKPGLFVIFRIEKKIPSKELSLDEAKSKIVLAIKDRKAKDFFEKILPLEFGKFSDKSTIIINKKYR